MTWKASIVGHGRIAPDQIIANPFNHRTHPQRQRDALAASIEEVGFIRSVTVNKRTGHLIDGHERVWQALKTEQPLIDVEYVDLSEADELKALAVMDRVGEMAEIDTESLESLLREVESDNVAIQAMLDEMADEAGLDLGGDVVEDEPPIDQASELLKKWKVERGQLWEIVGPSGLVTNLNCECSQI